MGGPGPGALGHCRYRSDATGATFADRPTDLVRAELPPKFPGEGDEHIRAAARAELARSSVGSSQPVARWRAAASHWTPNLVDNRCHG